MIVGGQKGWFRPLSIDHQCLFMAWQMPTDGRDQWKKLISGVRFFSVVSINGSPGHRSRQGAIIYLLFQCMALSPKNNLQRRSMNDRSSENPNVWSALELNNGKATSLYNIIHKLQVHADMQIASHVTHTQWCQVLSKIKASIWCAMVDSSQQCFILIH